MHLLSRLFAYPFARLLTLLRWLALLGLMLGAAIPATAKTYTDNGDGTVTDPTTGLMWMRCSMGQTWDGATSACTGTASSYDWDQAVVLTNSQTFAGHSDWRLPNIRELQTIVDRTVYNPAIDAAAFPNTPASSFWSASAYANYFVNAWVVNFNYGFAYNDDKNYSYAQVRLVRAGQSFGLLDIARPSTDYVDQGNGTVAHTPTRLMWQRCAVGQSWTGSTCSGTASTFTWDAAKGLTSSLAGQNDWRLPTEEELLSLVDYSRYSPAINVALFPNTPASNFWSASAYAYSSSGAWVVNFGNGYADGYDKYYGYQVRLVRAGQCFGLLPLTVSKTGTGQVNSTLPTGISCDAVSGGGYYPGDVVTLSATPIANFISWGGACSGSAPTCSVTMDAAKSVTASFLVVPEVSIVPSALTFATQNIGSTSSAQQATLTNTGSAALTGLGISASADYAVNHNCGTSLSAGGFCTLNVTFTPSASGTRTGSISISSNAPGSPHSVALSGTGQGATSVLSPTSLSFAAQGVGSSSAAQTVTLSNSGGAVLNIASKLTNGAFAISASTCGATLAKASTCNISVIFQPTAVGAQVGSLVISSDAANSPATVGLSGSGLPMPYVALSPLSLSFAAQTVGSTSSAQTVTLRNTGAATLVFSSGIASSGDFSQGNDCGGGLGAGSACSISVSFRPTAIGVRSGSLTIGSNAVGSPASLSLSGTGRSPDAPVCTLSAVPAKLRKGETSTLTASCSPAATSYVWAGGNCAAVTTNTCVETVNAITAYSVTGTNSFGSDTAAATVTVKPVDLTPILMLLLD